MMKKVCFVTMLAVMIAITAEADSFYTGLPRNVRKEEVIASLKKIVKLFNGHAAKMGGAGFSYGIKSNLIYLFDDSNRDDTDRDLLEKYILRTPEYMLHASGISEDDPAFVRTFVKFCRLMPTIYDTYQVCREKILLCIKAMYPDESDKFCQDLLIQIYD